MSRKHPGKSKDYNHKKEVRKNREFERVRLLLAKIRFYKELGRDYEEMRQSAAGKAKSRKLLNRARLKRIKKSISDEEVDNYIREKCVKDEGSPSWK